VPKDNAEKSKFTHYVQEPFALVRFTLLALLTFSLFSVARGQAPSTRIYRGAIGDKHIDMRLNISGSKVDGTYFYDQFKQDIKLEGAYDSKGELSFTEGTGKKKTGKFVCKAEPEAPDTDLECEWSRLDGTGKRLVYLVEQWIQFKSGTEITPKITVDPKTKAFASYPQLKAPAMTAAMNGLNRLVESKLQTAIKGFQPENVANSSFDTNYNVLLANDEVVSVEMVEYSDVGAAHPNSRFWTINHNLKTNKQLSLSDVFSEGDEYKTVIAEFAAKDINRRAEEMDRQEARRNNRQPEKRDEPVMSVDQLPEMDTWGISPRGLVVYFDFPHVMAVFDKTIVPWALLARFLRADGVVPTVK
jgi:hypothetical protein